MKLWMAYAALGVSAGLILMMALAGCTSPDPTGPSGDIIVQNNTAPVTVTTNTTAGSSSNIGTAPCGASSTQKTSSGAGPATPGGPNCSTQANGNNPVADIADAAP